MFLENIAEGNVALPLKKENLIFKNVNSHILASNSLCIKTIKSFLSKNLFLLNNCPPKLENDAAIMGKRLADWIIQQPHADFSPAFGAGCCSSLNPVRLKMLEKAKA